MDNICFLNVRGLNNPKNQKEVLRTLQMSKVALCGLTETKLRKKNFGKMAHHVFSGWCFTSKFSMHNGGRILIAWILAINEVTPFLVSERLYTALFTTQRQRRPGTVALSML